MLVYPHGFLTTQGNGIVSGAVVNYDFMDASCYTDGSTTATNLGTLGGITAVIPASWTNASGHLLCNSSDATFTSGGIDQDGMSYEFWIKTNSYINQGLNQSLTATTPRTNGCETHVYNGTPSGDPGHWYVRGSSVTAYSAPECVYENVWNNLIATFNGTTATVYRNGVLIGSGTVTTVGSSSTSVVIGNPYPVTGDYLDIWRVYHSVFSLADAEQNFEAEKSRFGY